MTELRILAFDTSGPHCAASLVIDGQVVASASEEMRKGQAERLMPLLDEVMAKAGTFWADVDGIGVGVGPGNFTGVRISVAAARGLSLSLGVPAIGVSVFEALRGPEWFRNTEPQYVVAPSTRRGNDILVQRFEAGHPTQETLEGAVFAGTGGTFPLTMRPDTLHRVLGPVDLAHAFNAALQNGEGLVSETEIGANGGQRHAERIALVAALKLAEGDTIPRPAPLYMRPADAAPASDPPPVILP